MTTPTVTQSEPSPMAKWAAPLGAILITALYYIGLAVYCWARPDATILWEGGTVVMVVAIAPILLAFASMTVSFMVIRHEATINRVVGGAATAFALCLLVTVKTDGPDGYFFRDSILATQARGRVQSAEASLGEAPAIKARVLQITSSRKAVEDNREFLRSVAAAETDKKAIVAWLAAAEDLQVNDAFVAQNAMVRPKDQGRLFDRAIERARSGDATAQAWLARQRR